ncbi:Hypothetical predicted protein [Podarcis lilfordi]|uniref:Uncharacterized protein n=1 Tax=Podarcis lilfordi TaxID=74358 RepID=A0AA35L2G2_9SAUR|nr:Hypothetical predicted protein [Podarcis lilfordi]
MPKPVRAEISAPRLRGPLREQRQRCRCLRREVPARARQLREDSLTPFLSGDVRSWEKKGSAEGDTGCVSGHRGISTERNFRARHLLKGQKAEVKATVPAAAAAPAPMDAWKSAGQAPGQQVPDKVGMKSASLKDLCPENKRHLANLIKELASCP